jgi:hypothetical protein
VNRWIRRTTVAALIVGLLGALVVVGFVYARSKLLSLLEAKTGASVSFEALRPVADGIRVSGLELRWPGRSVEIRVRELRADGGWRRLFSGRPRHIALSDVAIRVDTNQPFPESLRRRDRQSSDRSELRTADTSLELVDAKLLVLDSDGEVASFSGLHARGDLTGFSGQLGQARLGGVEHHERVDASGVVFEVARAPTGWRLGSARVESLSAVAADAEFRGAQASLFERVRLASRWRSRAEGDREVVAGRVWSERIGRVEVGDASFRWWSAAGEQVLLDSIRASIESTDGGHFQTSGEGGSDGGRRVVWNFRGSSDFREVVGDLRFEALPLGLIASVLPDVPWSSPEHARLDGRLTLSAEGAERIRYDGMLRIGNAAFAHPRIAPAVVGGIHATLVGQGTLVRSARTLVVDEMRLQVGTAHVELRGRVEWPPDRYLIDLNATLPRAPCDAVLGMVPRSVLDEVAGFAWSGTMAGDASVFVDSRDLSATRVGVRLQDQCEFVTVPYVADLRRFERSFLHRVLEPDGTSFEMETGPGTERWTPIALVSPFLVHAVLAHEDAGFFSHHGFVPSQFRVALARNLEAGRYVQGASTVTMQLVKNVFLHREKTLARKLQEAVLTWWIERNWSKDRILELYLNVIEYGFGVYGIRQASEHYFGREPAQLSLAESVFLANVLPNPKVYQAQYAEGRPNARTIARMGGLMRRMRERGRIDEDALEAGLAELATFRFHRDGEPAPEPRELVGGVAALPIPTYVGDDAPDRERELEVLEEDPRAIQEWEMPAE